MLHSIYFRLTHYHENLIHWNLFAHFFNSPVQVQTFGTSIQGWVAGPFLSIVTGTYMCIKYLCC